MASFETIDHFGPEPPPRPTTPAVRRGFLLVLAGLSLAAGLVYGVPYMFERAGYAYEAGRSRAAGEALARLDEKGVIAESSALFRMTAAKVGPAVVNIRSFRSVANPRHNNRRELQTVGAGSGVVIDKDRGFIATNHHVIKDGEEFIVRPGRGGEYAAKVVGADPLTDLAVLQVSDAPFMVEASWGDPDKMAVGDWVLAIGSPFLLDQTVTKGIISATGRTNLHVIGEGSYEEFLQTDAAINPGNSGGPLVNLRGEIIGINTAISVEGGMPGIGLAITAKLARRVTKELIEHGKVSRGYLGVMLENVPPDAARQLHLPDARGAMIRDVDPDGPADRAGLKPGDFVVKLDDEAIADLNALRNKATGLAIGKEVPVVYYRDGKEVRAQVKIGAMPALRLLGLRLRDQPPDEVGKPGPIIDLVQFDSPAAHAGLEPGLRVVAVGEAAVRNKAEADAASERPDPSGGIPLTVLSPNGRIAKVVVGAHRNGGRGPGAGGR